MSDITFIYIQQAMLNYERIDDNLLKTYLSKAEQFYKYPFGFIVNKITWNDDISIEDKYNYAYELIERIFKFLNYEYTLDDLKILSTYFVIKATNIQAPPFNEELVALCEEAIKLNPSQEIFKQIQDAIRLSYIILYSVDFNNFSNGVIEQLLTEINPEGIIEIPINDILLEAINE